MNENIKKFIEEFEATREPNERDTSFDYCYNYFYSFYKGNKLHELANEENLQRSCLQLGFYLASWGMLRNSFLLKKSVRYFSDLIKEISKIDPKLWEIDVDNYNDENIKLLLDCQLKIIEVIKNNSDTLITKIMLGVFANVPAYDYYFRIFLKENKCCQTFNKKSLEQIKFFYEEHKNEFDSYKICTYDFSTKEKTEIIYTKAKLVDMYGFMVGEKG